jgi:hypothetical protein
MKKFIELIQKKEREDKQLPNNKKTSAKEEKAQSPVQAPGQNAEQPQDLFWDDYSDVGYC